MSGENSLFRIRNYRAQDLAKLHEIDHACFAPDIAFSKAEMFSHLSRHNSITRIAEISGTVVGFVVGRVDGPLFSHVLTLDVLPGARRSKIGTSLMGALHSEFRNRHVRWTVLEVNASDLGARQFYEKLNYRYVETIRGYYNGREDALRMVRPMTREDPD